MLITAARIVAHQPGSAEPVDLRLRDGRVTEVGLLRPDKDEQVVAGQGRWLIPGLWDAHVHFQQWVMTTRRLDLSATRSAAEVLALVGAAPGRRDELLVGFGYRLSQWPDAASREALDAVTGPRPAVLISGDAHNGWLNTAAAGLLGIEPPAGLLREHEWFDQMSRLLKLELAGPGHQTAFDRAVSDALGRGIVGLVDLDFDRCWQTWLPRAAAGAPMPRVRTGVYPDHLQEIIANGWRSGDQLDGLVEMGPLKIISDGALGTLTAHCRVGYLDASGQPAANHGVQSVSAEALTELLDAAREHGLQVAVHAIGDAALDIALEAFEQTGARGSIEHAQLADPAQLSRMARLAVFASVQPAQLPDDAEVMSRVWGDRTANTFPLRKMLDSGVRLRFGSDAPISRLDPWLQLDAAVRRPTGWGADAVTWHREQALTPGQALFASTDGQGPIRVGSRADLVLLDADPHDTPLAEMRCARTIVAGVVVDLA